MNYDNGEVLQGVEEDWSFMGANALEWASGLVVFFIISLFGSTPTRAMPFMIIGWILTTTTLAAIRRTFPDEQRGLRNAVMTACGFVPPKMPAPAVLQPLWSACPIKEIPRDTKFSRLGLDKLFPTFERDSSPEVDA